MGRPSRFVRFLASPWPYRILRIGLALVFIYAGAVKLMHPRTFAGVISSYDLLPEVLLPVVAIGLPVLEVIAGVGLVFDVRGSLGVVSALLMGFVFVLGYGVLNDMEIDCGCFGAVELATQQSLRNAFYRDIVLVAVAVFLYLSRRTREKQVSCDMNSSAK